jgi:hypothetical protein
MRLFCGIITREARLPRTSSALIGPLSVISVCFRWIGLVVGLPIVCYTSSPPSGNICSVCAECVLYVLYVLCVLSVYCTFYMYCVCWVCTVRFICTACAECVLYVLYVLCVQTHWRHGDKIGYTSFRPSRNHSYIHNCTFPFRHKITPQPGSEGTKLGGPRQPTQFPPAPNRGYRSHLLP